MDRYVIHLTMKSKAWMRKGVTIHWAVNSAHKTWSSSNKKKKVDKSVRTSVKPSITLKNVNFSISILKKIIVSYLRKAILQICAVLELFSKPAALLCDKSRRI